VGVRSRFRVAVRAVTSSFDNNDQDAHLEGLAKIRCLHACTPARAGSEKQMFRSRALPRLSLSAPPLQRRVPAANHPKSPQLGMPHCTPGPEIEGVDAPTETRGPPLTILLRRCAARHSLVCAGSETAAPAIARDQAIIPACHLPVHFRRWRGPLQIKVPQACRTLSYPLDTLLPSWGRPRVRRPCTPRLV
jgi:hypothetical protein